MPRGARTARGPASYVHARRSSFFKLILSLKRSGMTPQLASRTLSDAALGRRSINPVFSRSRQSFSAGAICTRAGTTGSITGVFRRRRRRLPERASSQRAPRKPQPSTTDASGRFALLSLAPDTYTITVSKDGFETSSLTGVSVFADQLQTIRVALAPSLRTIAHVTARSSMDLVKSGTTSDVYSVNSTVDAGRSRPWWGW